MRKTAFTICALLVLSVSTGAVLAFQKYDPVKFEKTSGYDPAFLQDTMVINSCISAQKDLQKVGLPNLGYCREILGTP